MDKKCLDKDGKTFFVRFNSSEDAIIAFSVDEERIAEFSFDEVAVGEDDTILQLCHMHVEPAYQGKEIGTEMIKFAVENLDFFLLPSSDNNPQTRSDNYLTNEGHSFILSCFKKNIFDQRFQDQFFGSEVEDDLFHVDD